MFGKIKALALYGGTDRESYSGIKNRIEESNRKTALVFGTVGAALIGVMLVLSFFLDGFAGSRNVYIIGAVLSVLIVLTAFFSVKVPALTYAAVYMAIAVFLLYGIAIATLTRPEEQTVTFMVMLIFVPLIFVDRPWRMAFSLAVYIVLFIVMAFMTKEEPVLSVDITDAVIFGILAIVSETVVYRTKIRGYVLENKLKTMSETDQLTGLNNRNCYEWRLEQYPELCKRSICCIYIDVNGLHELNNTMGHKAGDDMLCCIANIVKDNFGSRDTYRIGGDEYVAFAPDVPQDEVASRITKMRLLIAEQGYHAAMGCEFCEKSDISMKLLIVGAESKMYKDKAEYYSRHDRRAR
ncbi:MAG: diguanylate cyclase [Ruminiclostridium sp.]|nr:diguanylate cyclase [Ruminiclostridium sp.]